MVSSVIDFTQSRLTAPDGSLAFTDLAADPAVFEGPEGNVQVRAKCWWVSALEFKGQGYTSCAPTHALACRVFSVRTRQQAIVQPFALYMLFWVEPES